MPLAVDNLLNNRYRIHKIIAQGGMGAIYRAVDETLAIEVAVKENLITSQESSRQFHREATILAGVRHPNLPRVTDHFVIPDQGQYLVMDYISGEDLRQRIDRSGLLSESEAVLIITAACDALTYLHTSQPPIVHRDIKPGNIKVTPDGQVFLVDFGLAKISQSGKATTIGAQALTPGYAPPEQYGRGTDSRSDIYSLGATLYAALTGKIPEDSLARATGSAQLTPPRTHNPHLSLSLAAVIEKAMSIDPAQRFQTAAEFKQALLEANISARRTLEETRKVRVTPAPPSQPPPLHTIHAEVDAQAQPSSAKASSHHAAAPVVHATPPVAPSVAPVPIPAPRRKLPWIAIAGVVFVLLAGGGAAVALIGGGSQKTPPTEPTQQLVASVSSPTLPAVGATARLEDTSEPPPTEAPTLVPTEAATQQPAATDVPVVTPQGGASGQIAFVSDRAGLPQVFIWESPESDPRQLTNFPGGACQPDWSPDGQRVVFISPCAGKQDEYRNASLFILNADSSGLVRLDTQPGGDFEPAWSPDGTMIAFTSLRDPIKHIFLYELASNQVIRLSPPSSKDSKPAWSPDGSRIAFETTRSGEMQIWTVSPDGSNPREFSPAGGHGDSMPAWSPDDALIYYVSGSSRPVLRARPYGAAGAQETQISETQPVWNPSISPDASLIVFDGLLDNNPAIFVIDRNGGDPRVLISHAGADFDPVWRP